MGETGKFLVQQAVNQTTQIMIPHTWKLKPLKEVISSVEAGVSVNSEDRPILEGEKGVLKVSCVTYGVFAPNEHKSIVKAEEDDVSIFPQRNRILVSRANTPKFVGASVYIDRDYPNLFLSDELWQLAVDDKRFSIRWLIQALNSEQVRSTISSSATGSSGSMKNISQQSFLRIKIPVPPIAEQKKIAEILGSWDEAIALTEKAIEARQKLKKKLLLELLSNKKHIDQVEKTKTGYICTSIVPGRNKPVHFNGDIPWITISDLEDRFWISESKAGLAVSREELQKAKGKTVPKNTVIMTCVGKFGIVAVAAKELVINQQLHGFVCSEKVLPEYLCWVLRSKEREMLSLAGQTTVSYMNSSCCESITINLPCIEKQRKISNILNLAQDGIEKVSRLRDLLQKQKRGLMQKLLTGQWRVKTEGLTHVI